MNQYLKKHPKILFLCLAPPYGEVNGMGQRTRVVAKRLSEIGDLSLISLSPSWTERDESETKHHFNLARSISPQPATRNKLVKLVNLLNPHALQTHPLDLSTSDKRYLHEQIHKHDLVWIHTIKVANLVGIRRYRHSILDADDFPSRYCIASITAKHKLSEKLRYAALFLCWRIKERTFKSRFDSIVVCKKSDQSSFGCPDRTFVVPNTIQSPPTPPAFPSSPMKHFGLIGNFQYELNTDATEWLLRNCWQQIRSTVPDAQLRLIGKGSEVYTNANEGVWGLGFVDDPSIEMANWTAMVAPIRYGGGTSVKIAEALASSLPVITTKHGARGYLDYPNCPLLIEDTPSAFAKACTSLALNPKEQRKRAKDSRAFFTRHLESDKVTQGIDLAIQQARKSKSHPAKNEHGKR